VCTPWETKRFLEGQGQACCFSSLSPSLKTSVCDSEVLPNPCSSTLVAQHLLAVGHKTMLLSGMPKAKAIPMSSYFSRRNHLLIRRSHQLESLTQDNKTIMADVLNRALSLIVS
jgi:hypothetical protein